MTSGAYSPNLKKNVGMGYVDKPHDKACPRAPCVAPCCAREQPHAAQQRASRRTLAFLSNCSLCVTPARCMYFACFFERLLLCRDCGRSACRLIKIKVPWSCWGRARSCARAEHARDCQMREPQVGTELRVVVRGKANKAEVAKAPFVPTTYYKGK